MQTVETEKFFAVGNNLSLDFINTDIVDNGKQIDLLEKTADLAAWAAAMNLIEKSQAAQIVKNWSAKASDEKLLGEVRVLRRNLRELIDKIRLGAKFADLQVEFLNDYLRKKSGGFAEIIKNENGFEKKFPVDYREPTQIFAVVAESAADLLCYANLENVKKCESKECVLYFYDVSKNHTRRWCSMTSCGNRAKAAAFYQRKKTKTSD